MLVDGARLRDQAICQACFSLIPRTPPEKSSIDASAGSTSPHTHSSVSSQKKPLTSFFQYVILLTTEVLTWLQFNLFCICWPLGCCPQEVDSIRFRDHELTNSDCSMYLLSPRIVSFQAPVKEAVYFCSRNNITTRERFGQSLQNIAQSL